MRRVTVIATALMLTAPVRLGAWGFEVHRFLVQQAIPLLPDPIRPFYEKYRVVVVEHSIDPDLWRSAGFEEEPPRHFIDLDAYGVYPFTGLPRDYAAAVKQFGAETIKRNGLLPWRTEEIYGLLERAFERLGRRQPYAYDDIKFFSAVLAHYVSDAHVPLHAVVNYDGQLTNQRGIHGRFESELFLRYQSTLAVKPVPRAPIRSARDFVFDTMLDSFQLAGPLLLADRHAVAGRTEYDDVYFDRFLSEVRPILERRLSEAAAAVAAMITGAWEQAGRPELPLEAPRTVQKVTRPGA